MAEENFIFSPQCEQKGEILPNLIDTVDHYRKSGNHRKKECAFLKETEKCHGYRPNATPIFTLGTSTSSSLSMSFAFPFGRLFGVR